MLDVGVEGTAREPSLLYQKLIAMHAMRKTTYSPRARLCSKVAASLIFLSLKARRAREPRTSANMVLALCQAISKLDSRLWKPTMPRLVPRNLLRWMKVRDAL